MKIYVSSREIAHLWAHQTQPEGKCSSAMSFNGTKFYSYSTCIAEIITVKKTGRTIYVVSGDTYSSTTSRHLGHVRSAIPHSATVFAVPGIRRGSYQDIGDPERVLSVWRDEAVQLLEEAATSRQPKKNRLFVEAGDLVDKMWRFAEAMSFAKSKTKKLIPKLPAKQELLDTWRAELEATRQKAEAKRQAILERANATRRAEQEENLAKWLNGDRTPALSYNLPRERVELRVIDDQVETSLGVTFPLSHAKRGLKLVDKVMKSGNEWKSNGHTCKLGHYQIEHIATDGTVQAGCHIVTIAAINRIRTQIESSVLVEA